MLTLTQDIAASDDQTSRNQDNTRSQNATHEGGTRGGAENQQQQQHRGLLKIIKRSSNPNTTNTHTKRSPPPGMYVACAGGLGDGARARRVVGLHRGLRVEGVMLPRESELLGLDSLLHLVTTSSHAPHPSTRPATRADRLPSTGNRACAFPAPVKKRGTCRSVPR